MFAASPIQFMPLKSYRSSCNRLIFNSRDRAPTQFMPLSITKSSRSSCNRPIFNQSSSLRLRCEAVKYDLFQIQPSGNEFDCVIKFDSSSVESAAGIIEIANFIRILDRTLYGTIRSSENFKNFDFKEMRLVIIVSAIGKTINKLQLAGEKALTYGYPSPFLELEELTFVPYGEELTFIKDLHLRTADELEIDREIVSKHFFELEQFLKWYAGTKCTTPSTKDYLFSFGERMSSRLLVAYLNKIGVKSEQYDPFAIGGITAADLKNDPTIRISSSSRRKSMKPSEEGNKHVQVKIFYNPKAP